MNIKEWLKSLLWGGRRAKAKARISVFVSDVLDAKLDDGVVELRTATSSITFRPSNRPPFSPGRLVFSDELRRSHTEQMQEFSLENLQRQESSELRRLLAPVLVDWTSTQQNIDVLELGPAYTTVIAEALEQRLGSYCGVDFSYPYLQKQQEILAAKPALRFRCRTLVSDTFSLKIPARSVDLVVTSCHPPLVSAPVSDKKLVLTKIHEMLRPGGSFAIFPWLFSEQPSEVNEHLLKLFALRRFAHLSGQSSRAFLILVKR